MILPKVLEPDSDQAERECLHETLAVLEEARANGDPRGMIANAISMMRYRLATVDQRPHRGLVDYDQRVHG
jgi:hypothetical protein